MKIKHIDKLLIYVNSGLERPNNQYASLLMAFAAKKLHKIPEVVVYYGPLGVEMVRKGNLEKLECSHDLKKLVAGQFKDLNPEDLPDNLEQMARYVKDVFGVKFTSCATFHVVNRFATTLDDTTNIEDFIIRMEIPEAAEAALTADKILYF
jgi:predicted peroxiredoxin